VNLIPARRNIRKLQQRLQIRIPFELPRLGKTGKMDIIVEDFLLKNLVTQSILEYARLQVAL
jgi:hypothetical protein